MTSNGPSEHWTGRDRPRPTFAEPDAGPHLATHLGSASLLPHGHHHERTSVLLRRLAFEESSEKVTVGRIAEVLADRTYGAMFLLLAMINFIPAPPGFGAMFGPFILVFAVQMIAGRSNPWLPSFLARRGFKRQSFQKGIGRVAGVLEGLERIGRPRLMVMTSPIMLRVLGCVAVVLGIAMCVPIPFTNIVPAVALAILAVGLIEGDGAIILAGHVAAVICTVIVGFLAYYFVVGVWHLFSLGVGA